MWNQRKKERRKERKERKRESKQARKEKKRKKENDMCFLVHVSILLHLFLEAVLGVSFLTLLFHFKARPIECRETNSRLILVFLLSEVFAEDNVEVVVQCKGIPF